MIAYIENQENVKLVMLKVIWKCTLSLGLSSTESEADKQTNMEENVAPTSNFQ